MSNLSKICPFSEAEWLNTVLLVSGPLWLWRLTGLTSGMSCSEFGDIRSKEEAVVMKVNFSSQVGSSTSVLETFSFSFMVSYSCRLSNTCTLSFTCRGFLRYVQTTGLGYRGSEILYMPFSEFYLQITSLIKLCT